MSTRSVSLPITTREWIENWKRSYAPENWPAGHPVSPLEMPPSLKSEGGSVVNEVKSEVSPVADQPKALRKPRKPLSPEARAKLLETLKKAREVRAAKIAAAKGA